MLKKLLILNILIMVALQPVGQVFAGAGNIFHASAADVHDGMSMHGDVSMDDCPKAGTPFCPGMDQCITSNHANCNSSSPAALVNAVSISEDRGFAFSSFAYNLYAFSRPDPLLRPPQIH